MKEVYNYTKEKMTKTLEVLKKDYAAIRAGRATASVSVAEARILTIQPWDKSILHAIEKAIQTSDIGINPQNDGSVIRLTFPQLTEDHRKSIVKNVSKMAEDSKVAIRSIRRDAMDKLKKMQKASEITEDDLKNGEDEIQKITDGFVKDIDKVAQAKEKEVMEI